jgi:RsiW-degrading membrane proteinase PrsW (M82 family)
VLAYWKSLASFLPQANADLIFLAHAVKPLRRANELVGDFHAAEQLWDKALQYYGRELRVDAAASTRAKILAVHLEQRDLAEVRRLAADPQFVAGLTPSMQLTVAAVEGRWTRMLAAAFHVVGETFQSESLLLASVAGIVWFIIALQAIEPSEAKIFRTVVPLAAVLAGAASTILTLAVGTWQEKTFGLSEGEGFYQNLYFFIAGVGPREEIIKLLFFLPFVPLLVRRGNELESLIVAACVGLGFAVAENLLYFAREGGAIAYARFLTANFLHMAATGLVGLAFCRMLQQPRRGLLLFLITIALVMLAHGVYDAFLMVRGVRIFAAISIGTYMALSFAFFQQLRTRRSGLTDQFSLAGTLILGLALLTGLMLFCAARQLGLAGALLSLASSVIMLWIFASMLHWQLGEGMSAMHEKPETPQFS